MPTSLFWNCALCVCHLIAQHAVKGKKGEPACVPCCKTWNLECMMAERETSFIRRQSVTVHDAMKVSCP